MTTEIMESRLDTKIDDLGKKIDNLGDRLVNKMDASENRLDKRMGFVEGRMDSVDDKLIAIRIQIDDKFDDMRGHLRQNSAFMAMCIMLVVLVVTAIMFIAPHVLGK